uniref:Uncharacterized protein n=1 Tax=Aegilops tauschii subsp. strangulata TaxID=200361 RepID=A0A453BY64_AEGTS
SFLRSQKKRECELEYSGSDFHEKLMFFFKTGGTISAPRQLLPVLLDLATNWPPASPGSVPPADSPRFPKERKERRAMAMAALREASRRLASISTWSPAGAATRPLLLTHSRGITHKLFIGG